MEEFNKMKKETIINRLHSHYSKELNQINDIILSCLQDSNNTLIYQISDYLIKAGGKRIRPILTILSSQLFGYVGTAHISLATATEFIHAATLLHDDVIDSSLVRRFKPTANSVWGDQAVILVGDYLFSQAFILMVEADSMESLKTLAQASSIIAKGEVLQLENVRTKKEITRDEYFRTIEAKTAELFAACCKVGAVIAKTSEQNINLIYEYGKYVGLIFQIKDDMLDYFSNVDKIGKNIGDDFLEGKMTLPLIVLIEKASKLDRKSIEISFFDLSLRKSENFKTIVDLMTQYKIKEEIELMIEQYANLAFKCLEHLNIEENINTKFLKEIINFASQRDN